MPIFNVLVLSEALTLFSTRTVSENEAVAIDMVDNVHRQGIGMIHHMEIPVHFSLMSCTTISLCVACTYCAYITCAKQHIP